MKNMLQMIREAGTLRKNVKKIQSQLRQKTVEFSCKSGQVTAVARGDGTIANLRIDAAAVDPGRASELEQMVLEAVDGALGEAKKLSGAEMRSFAAEMGLPDIPGL